MRRAGHCLSSPVLPGDEDVLTLSWSVSYGFIVHRLASASLKNEITVYYFFVVTVLIRFDSIPSELLVSVAQQKQTSQINQCLFVALEGTEALVLALA